MKKKNIVRVGLVKDVPVRWDPRTNWSMFKKLATQAVEKGAQIICTPECYLDGYAARDEKGWTRDRFDKISYPLTGPGYVRKVKEFAAKHGVYLIFGFTEKAKGGSYNSAALIDDKGELLGCYRKTHIVKHDKRFLAGDDFPVWDTPLGKIGILICADRSWPEAARTLRVRGAEIIVIVSYGSWGIENERKMMTRASENSVVLCFVHPNVSFIIDPTGKLDAKLQSNIPGVLVHDIDLSKISQYMWDNRRPDLYKL